MKYKSIHIKALLSFSEGSTATTRRWSTPTASSRDGNLIVAICWRLFCRNPPPPHSFKTHHPTLENHILMFFLINWVFRIRVCLKLLKIIYQETYLGFQKQKRQHLDIQLRSPPHFAFSSGPSSPSYRLSGWRPSEPWQKRRGEEKKIKQANGFV